MQLLLVLDVKGLCCLQGVAEAESVPAGVGAAAQLDQSRGGGRLRAAAVLVHARWRRERARRPGRCTNTEQFTAVFTKQNTVLKTSSSAQACGLTENDVMTIKLLNETRDMLDR